MFMLINTPLLIIRVIRISFIWELMEVFSNLQTVEKLLPAATADFRQLSFTASSLHHLQVLILESEECRIMLLLFISEQMHGKEFLAVTAALPV